MNTGSTPKQSDQEAVKLPVRNTNALHRGRLSWTDARYFVTCVAECGGPALTSPSVGEAILAAVGRLETDGNIRLSCLTLMPDHLHALFTLAGSLTIGQVVGKLKALAGRSRGTRGVVWQRDFFEHRLRPEDSVAGFARYIFMNPYRAGLCGGGDEWPWWRVNQDECQGLMVELEEGRFPPEAWFEFDTQRLGVQPRQVGEES